jgi:hypothetical protein
MKNHYLYEKIKWLMWIMVWSTCNLIWVNGVDFSNCNDAHFTSSQHQPNLGSNLQPIQKTSAPELMIFKTK